MRGRLGLRGRAGAARWPGRGGRGGAGWVGGGPAGPAGASGSSGARARGRRARAGGAGFSYQGTYASATNYAVSDVVLYRGSSYISLMAGNHGNTPGLSPGQWGLLAAGGRWGPAGPAGATAGRDRGIRRGS